MDVMYVILFLITVLRVHQLANAYTIQHSTIKFFGTSSLTPEINIPPTQNSYLFDDIASHANTIPKTLLKNNSYKQKRSVPDGRLKLEQKRTEALCKYCKKSPIRMKTKVCKKCTENTPDAVFSIQLQKTNEISTQKASTVNISKQEEETPLLINLHLPEIRTEKNIITKLNPAHNIESFQNILHPSKILPTVFNKSNGKMSKSNENMYLLKTKLQKQNSPANILKVRDYITTETPLKISRNEKLKQISSANDEKPFHFLYENTDQLSDTKEMDRQEYLQNLRPKRLKDQNNNNNNGSQTNTEINMNNSKIQYSKFKNKLINDNDAENNASEDSNNPILNSIHIKKKTKLKSDCYEKLEQCINNPSGQSREDYEDIDSEARMDSETERTSNRCEKLKKLLHSCEKNEELAALRHNSKFASMQNQKNSNEKVLKSIKDPKINTNVQARPNEIHPVNPILLNLNEHDDIKPRVPPEFVASKINEPTKVIMEGTNTEITAPTDLNLIEKNQGNKNTHRLGNVNRAIENIQLTNSIQQVTTETMENSEKHEHKDLRTIKPKESFSLGKVKPIKSILERKDKIKNIILEKKPPHLEIKRLNLQKTPPVENFGKEKKFDIRLEKPENEKESRQLLPKPLTILRNINKSRKIPDTLTQLREKYLQKKAPMKISESKLNRNIIVGKTQNTQNNRKENDVLPTTKSFVTESSKNEETLASMENNFSEKQLFTKPINIHKLPAIRANDNDFKNKITDEEKPVNNIKSIVQVLPTTESKHNNPGFKNTVTQEFTKAPEHHFTPDESNEYTLEAVNNLNRKTSSKSLNERLADLQNTLKSTLNNNSDHIMEILKPDNPISTENMKNAGNLDDSNNRNFLRKTSRKFITKLTNPFDLVTKENRKSTPETAATSENSNFLLVSQPQSTRNEPDIPHQTSHDINNDNSEVTKSFSGKTSALPTKMSIKTNDYNNGEKHFDKLGQIIPRNKPKLLDLNTLHRKNKFNNLSTKEPVVAITKSNSLHSKEPVTNNNIYNNNLPTSQAIFNSNNRNNHKTEQPNTTPAVNKEDTINNLGASQPKLNANNIINKRIENINNKLWQRTNRIPLEKPTPIPKLATKDVPDLSKHLKGRHFLNKVIYSKHPRLESKYDNGKHEYVLKDPRKPPYFTKHRWDDLGMPLKLTTQATVTTTKVPHNTDYASSKFEKEKHKLLNILTSTDPISIYNHTKQEAKNDLLSLVNKNSNSAFPENSEFKESETQTIPSKISGKIVPELIKQLPKNLLQSRDPNKDIFSKNINMHPEINKDKYKHLINNKLLGSINNKKPEGNELTNQNSLDNIEHNKNTQENNQDTKSPEDLDSGTLGKALTVQKSEDASTCKCENIIPLDHIHVFENKINLPLVLKHNYDGTYELALDTSSICNSSECPCSKRKTNKENDDILGSSQNGIENCPCGKNNMKPIFKRKIHDNLAKHPTDLFNIFDLPENNTRNQQNNMAPSGKELNENSNKRLLRHLINSNLIKLLQSHNIILKDSEELNSYIDNLPEQEITELEKHINKVMLNKSNIDDALHKKLLKEDINDTSSSNILGKISSYESAKDNELSDRIQLKIASNERDALSNSFETNELNIKNIIRTEIKKELEKTNLKNSKCNVMENDNQDSSVLGEEHNSSELTNAKPDDITLQDTIDKKYKIVNNFLNWARDVVVPNTNNNT